MPQQPPWIYTADEVAAILRVDRRTVGRLLERGVLRGVKVGRVWRVTHTALHDFLEGGEREKGEEGRSMHGRPRH